MWFNTDEWIHFIVQAPVHQAFKAAVKSFRIIVFHVLLIVYIVEVLIDINYLSGASGKPHRQSASGKNSLAAALRTQEMALTGIIIKMCIVTSIDKPFPASISAWAENSGYPDSLFPHIRTSDLRRLTSVIHKDYLLFLDFICNRIIHVAPEGAAASFVSSGWPEISNPCQSISQPIALIPCLPP